MIKRLIFDIDNTLIDWKNEYDEIILKDCFEKNNISYNDTLIKSTIKALNKYEKNYNYFSKENFLENLTRHTNLDLTMKFINDYLDDTIKFGTPTELPLTEIQTLKYLHNKYELVLLTNWFASYQKQRLEKVDIYKYFSNLYAAENFKIKPNKESFLTALENYSIDECCVIGDNIKSDIKGALNLGLSAVYLSKNKNYRNKNFTCIQDFEDLRSIF